MQTQLYHLRNTIIYKHGRCKDIDESGPKQRGDGMTPERTKFEPKAAI